MARQYKEISRAAYLLDANAEPLIGQYLGLGFPEHWNPGVLALCNLGRDPDAEPYRTAPTRRLDGVLQTLAPDLIVRARTHESRQVDHEDHWLYVPADIPQPLPEPTFDRLTQAWLRDLAADLPAEPEYHHAVRDTLHGLQQVRPTWQPVDIDLLGCSATPGNTAITTPRQRQLAPDTIARRILDLDDYDHGAGTLKFRAVPRGPRQQGAELLSQPLPHDVKGETWWFSIYIAITMQTVVFDSRPRLHLHAGVRRWTTRVDKTGRVRLPGRTATSVYLAPTIPWLPGAPATDRYAIAALARNRATGRYEWGRNGPARILRQLQFNQPFPDPDLLLADPSAWIANGPGVRAAIVHSSRLGSHAIGTGLMSHQRSQLIEWAEQAMPTGVRRVSHLTRTNLGGSAPVNVRPTPVDAAAKKTEQARVSSARRFALAVATRFNLSDTPEPVPEVLLAPSPPDDLPILRTRLLWQTPELRDAAITALTEELGLDGDGRWPQQSLTSEQFAQAAATQPAILTWHTADLTVILRCVPLGSASGTGPGVAEKLGIDRRIRPGRKGLADAIQARRNAAREFLTMDPTHTGHPELALVEIDRRQDFEYRWDDPKYALRLGCADAQVLTQFAVVPKKAIRYNSIKNLSHRVRSAWHDGFRQLGVRVLPEHTLGGALPPDLRYAALWMVKRRNDGPTGIPRHTPVAVMVSPLGQGSGLATISGWDPAQLKWIPYPRLLLNLVKQAEIPDIGTDDVTTAEPGQPAANPTGVPSPRSDSESDAPSTRQRVTYRVWKQTLDEQRQETARFLQKMLRSLRGRSTLLFTHAQNSRQHWPWLQDGQAEPDLIKTGHAPASNIDADLRLLRVRDGDGRETAQWWGNAGPGGVNGLPPGLWTYPESSDENLGRIFYSTTAKASTFRDSAVEANRLAPRPLRQGVNRGQPTIDTHIPAWNPTLLELAVLACQPDDSPEALSLAAHQLRQAPDYLDALVNPLPLHMAALTQQYVLPTIVETDETAETETTEDPASPETDLRVGSLGIIIASGSPTMR